jgi:hypothetical protein
MKAYITWGVGYGPKILAQKNAQSDAHTEKIKFRRLESFEIPKCEFIESKKELYQLKGEFEGLVLNNCSKAEVAVAIGFGFVGDKILIGKGKGGTISGAEKRALAEINYMAKERNVELEGIKFLATAAPKIKDKFGCAVVALVLKE